MAAIKSFRWEDVPPLYRRIRYDTRLEAAGFARLVELDLEGCQSCFGRLVDQLDLSAEGTRRREITMLLLDVLSQVNRLVHATATNEAPRQAQRVALLEQFAACEEPEDARQAFMPALNRLIAPLRPLGSEVRPFLVDRAQSYIDENYHRRLSLSSVASHLHVSANYLSRLFHRETGMTLTCFVQRVRLQQAKLLLASGERSISEIAYLVGYQNYRDFYRNFVKYEGSSPRKLQKRLLSGAPETSRSVPKGDRS